MSVNRKHLKYRDFLSREMRTFNTLASDTRLAKIAPEFVKACKQFYHGNKKVLNKKTPDKHCEVRFGSIFEFEVQKKYHTVLLEALITENFEECSYAVSICNKEGVLVRKIHFDYAPVISKKDKKPLYHLQYGGEATPMIEELELNTEHIYSYLSVPRVDIAPMNLALFVDTVFCELNFVKAYPFIENSLWRDVVKNNENEILKPYYQNISDFFQHHTSDFLHRDFRYGKEQ